MTDKLKLTLYFIQLYGMPIVMLAIAYLIA